MSHELPYLISAEYHHFALYEARERQIPPNKWRYIPWEPRFERHHKLAGLAGYSEEKLIGWFSEEERSHLMRSL